MSRRFDLTRPDVAHLMRWVQDGVVARRQLEEHGARPCDIQRMVRRKELHPVHRGVFVDHNGPLTRPQQEWAAVLALWPAALCGRSVLPDPPPNVVHVLVDNDRRVKPPPRVFLHASTAFEERVDWRRSPPVQHLEDAVIDVVVDHLRTDDVAAAFAALTRAAWTRRTTPERILEAVAARGRVPRRSTITSLVGDLRDGASSVLERGYLHRVEHAHGLPRGTRQHRSTATGRRTDQDVRYRDQAVVVELDGRAFHDSPQARDADAVRDLAELAVDDAVTVRVTYAMVYGDQCRTAQWIAAILRRRGWTGQITRCPSCPPSQ